MTPLIDFLPATYRQRRVRLRGRRRRLLLALLVVAATVATDILFQRRIRGVRLMEQLAIQNADLSQQRAYTLHAVEHRVATLTADVDQWSAPLANPTASQVLDELLSPRPRCVRVQQLQCKVDPWGAAAPQLLVDASCRDLNDLAPFLAALRASCMLPPLQFKPTTLRQGDGGQSFRLESAVEAQR